jgi:hypothetical protein
LCFPTDTDVEDSFQDEFIKAATRPEFSSFAGAVRFKPCPQCRADFHKATLAGQAFCQGFRRGNWA